MSDSSWKVPHYKQKRREKRLHKKKAKPSAATLDTFPKFAELCVELQMAV